LKTHWSSVGPPLSPTRLCRWFYALWSCVDLWIYYNSNMACEIG
jgi:hypothetical protein